MTKLHILIRAGAVLAAMPAARAALQFTEVSSSNAGPGETKIQTLIDGGRFKATFVETASPVPPAGSYVLGAGDGKIYIVSPATQAYALFDPAQFAGMAAKSTDQMKQAKAQEEKMGMTRTIENYKLEKVLDEAGPQMFGYPTRHYRYTLSYQDVMHIKGMPTAMTTTIHEDREFWSTTAITEVAKGMEQVKALGGQSMDTGDEAANKSLEAEKVIAAHGMMLKSIVTHKASQGGMMGMMGALGGMGRSRGGGSTSKREVVALDHVKVSSDDFQLPKDYQETDMMSLFTAAAGGMPNLNATPGGPGGQPPPKMPDLNSSGG